MLSQSLNRIRRNHGLEHATIHVLSETHRQFSAQGNSTLRGFHLNVYGDISEADVAAAVDEALHRLQQGQSHLAVHPNCGTVLVTTAVMSTLAAMAPLALEQRRDPDGKHVWNALPGAMIGVVAALLVSRPVGMRLQERYTVDGRPGDLRVDSVRRVAPGLVTRLFQLLLAGNQRAATAYFVATSGGKA
jgi:hypothetical protein